jgi:hypothetical protein
MVRAALAALATLAATLAAAGSTAWAGPENAGTTGASFLAIEVGARPLGMGGAFTAVRGGAEHLAWNPAAAGGEAELAATHARLLGALSHDWVGFVSGPSRRGSRFGMSLGAMSIGSIDARDAQGTPTGELSSSAAVLGLSWLQPAGPLALGVTLKAMRQVVGEASGFGLAADLGLAGRLGPLDLAAVAQNLGPAFAFDGAGAPLPRDLRLGMAFAGRKEHWVAAADLEAPYDAAASLHAGIEARLHPSLVARGGYRLDLGDRETASATGPASLGAGTALRGLRLDYAYAGGGELEASHRVSLAYRFGPTGSSGDAPTRSLTSD